MVLTPVMAFKRPRGQCPSCGRRFALTKDGKIHRHVQRPGVSSAICGGSGQRPV